MGIRLVMVRVMSVCGFSLMVVVMVRGRVLIIAVDVGWARMGDERKGLVFTSPMVHKHMQRSEEKSNNNPAG